MNSKKSTGQTSPPRSVSEDTRDAPESRSPQEEGLVDSQRGSRVSRRSSGTRYMYTSKVYSLLYGMYTVTTTGFCLLC